MKKLNLLKTKQIWLGIVLFLSVILLVACGGSKKQLVVEPESLSFTEKGQSQQLTVKLDGKELSSGLTFTSEKPEVAVVSSKGLVTANGNGSTSVVVKHEKTEKKVPVTVTIGERVIPEGYEALAINQNPKVVDGKYSVAGKEFTVQDTYTTYYTGETDKAKFNYLTNSWVNNSEKYTNMVDGLLSHDRTSKLVAEMATHQKVSTDAEGNQVWQFLLRPNVLWMDNKTNKPWTHDGQTFEVTAEDFVTSAKYVLDPKNAAGAISMLNVIKGATEYTALLKENKPAEFNTVGVKAISKYEIQYTLKEKTPYFNTFLTYSPYLPLNAEFLNHIGTGFGGDENSILVNGAFVMSKHVDQNLIEFTKNSQYWDNDHVYVNKVTLKYIDSGAPRARTRELYEGGNIDGFVVNPKDAKGWKEYVGNGSSSNPENPAATSVKGIDSATFIGGFNFNRKNWEYSDGTVKTDAEKKAVSTAMLNVDFRRGFLYGIDVMKKAASASTQPEERIYRRFTNPELVSDKNGKDYTSYVDDEFNKQQKTTGINLSGIEAGYDPIFNPEKARGFFQKAYTQLLADGLKKADFPIKVDIIGQRDVVTQAYSEEAYAALEKAATLADGAKVVEVKLNVPQSDTQNTTWGRQLHNYDFTDWQGWGPDYADPKTFLATMILNGDMVDSFGLELQQEENIPGAEKQLTAAELKANKEQNARVRLVLTEYTAAAEKAFAVVDAEKLEERYKLMAEAEYKLLYDLAIIIPMTTRSGHSVVIGKTVPYQGNRSGYGITSDKYKNVVVADRQLTREERQALQLDFERARGVTGEKQSTISFENTRGWLGVVASGIKGAVGKKANLPEPVQDLTNVKPEERKAFEGWYLDEALTQKVQPNANGQYLFPEENVSYYLKSKPFVALTNIQTTNDAVLLKAEVGEVYEIKYTVDAGHTDKLTYKVMKGEEESHDVRVVIKESGSILIQPTAFGIYKVLLRGGQFLAGDNVKELPLKVEPVVLTPEQLSQIKVKLGEVDVTAQLASGVKLAADKKLHPVTVVLPEGVTKDSVVIKKASRPDGNNHVKNATPSGLSFNVLRADAGETVYTVVLEQRSLKNGKVEVKEVKTITIKFVD